MVSIFTAPYFQFQMRFKDIAIAASPKMDFRRLCTAVPVTLESFDLVATGCCYCR